MALNNPYGTGFGRVPSHFISRDILIDDIVDNLNSDPVQGQAYKLTGIRGTGKTVTLTAIERLLRKGDSWIVVGVKPEGNIMEELVSKLYNDVPILSDYISTELNLSKFGIGLNIKGKSPVSTLDSALNKIMKELQRRKKRLLVTIDEVKNSVYMREFVQEFQLLIREDLPIFLIVAGLYNDIENLENADHLTFFLRAEKYDMKPLNYTLIRDDYQKTLNVTSDVAENMAVLTKGYAFAYQALGKYMWDLKSKSVSGEVLMLFDQALAEKVYQKIWSELSPKERWFMGFIVQKDKMPVSELLEISAQKKNQFSVPRKGLKDKGLIDTSVRGVISLKLPRFKEFIEYQAEYGN